MVASEVKISTTEIDESAAQQDTTVTGTLDNLKGVDVIPTTTKPNDSSSIKKTNVYDFFVATSGSTSTTTVNIASRTVTVSKSIGTPVSIVSFFTNLLITGSPKLHVIPKVNKNGKQDYEIIYTNEGNSNVSATLFITTLDVPVGSVAPVFPAVFAAADPFATAVVLRDDTGLVKTYDYFMLSTQS